MRPSVTPSLPEQITTLENVMTPISPCRTVETHDPAITIVSDAPDLGGDGAPHAYDLALAPVPGSDQAIADHGQPRVVTCVRFQRGPRHLPTSMGGVTDQALLRVVQDRLLHLLYFGKNDQYAEALEHVRAALALLAGLGAEQASADESQP